MTHRPDTIAALATPVGTAAIAVVRVSGPEARALAERIFGAVPAPRVAHHADYRGVDGALIDDVLATFFAGPASYTGEDSLEVSAHGNPFIARKIVDDLLLRGCRVAEPGEFTRRAFLNGRMDLSQAEAVMDLIHARSERALAAANQQLRGSLGRRMEQFIALVINCLAQIEAYIDFPEEDLPPENQDALARQIQLLATEIGRLRATGRYGEVLRSGLRTVIIGEPNAGKSSLLNRLVGRDRALVSAEPGTTRDYLEELVSVGPHVLRLIDTAGLNETPTALERRGMEKTIEQADGADLFLWVLDVSRPLHELPERVRQRLTAENTVVVANKIDLQPDYRLPPLPYPVALVSAVTGAGLEELSRVISARADALGPEVGAEAVVINARHEDALRRAALAVEQARAGLERGAAGPGGSQMELVASDLRDALACLGEISGRVDNERMLDVLFSSFCIGK